MLDALSNTSNPIDILSHHPYLQPHAIGLPYPSNYQWIDRPPACIGIAPPFDPRLIFEDNEIYRRLLAMADRMPLGQLQHLAAESALWDLLFRSISECLNLQHPNRRSIVVVTQFPQLHAAEEHKDRVAQLTQVHAEELSTLREQIQRLTDDLNVALQMGTEAAEEGSRSKNTIHHLQIQNDALRALLARKSSGHDQNISIPSGYEGMAEWVETNLAGRLVFHPRAQRALADAQFDDPPLVYRSLILLAGHYRDMKRGIAGSKMAFERELSNLGLRYGHSISKERAGEQSEHYFIQYAGQRHFIDSHLRKNGNTRAPRRCLAIYFFWHDESEQIVVCSLPGHLPNAIS